MGEAMEEEEQGVEMVGEGEGGQAARMRPASRHENYEQRTDHPPIWTLANFGVKEYKNSKQLRA